MTARDITTGVCGCVLVKIIIISSCAIVNDNDERVLMSLPARETNTHPTQYIHIQSQLPYYYERLSFTLPLFCGCSRTKAHHIHRTCYIIYKALYTLLCESIADALEEKT